MAELKMNLRVWMFVKVIPAVILLTYYHMTVRTSFTPFDHWLQRALIPTLGGFIALAWKLEKDTVDERARLSKCVADSFSLRLSFVLLAVVMFASGFGSFSATVTGYLIGSVILFAAITRAIAFYIVDSKGV